jgi:hypothetical protein
LNSLKQLQLNRIETQLIRLWFLRTWKKQTVYLIDVTRTYRVSVRNITGLIVLARDSEVTSFHRKKWYVVFNRESVIFASILCKKLTDCSQNDRFFVKFDRLFFSVYELLVWGHCIFTVDLRFIIWIIMIPLYSTCEP